MLFNQVLIILVLSLLDAFANKTDTQNVTTEKNGTKYGYVTYDGYSYYKYHQDPQVWDNARKICVAEGGSLVIINSDYEANILRMLINQHPSITLNDVADDLKSKVLIGFHDYFEPGEYVTINGADLTDTGYTTWAEQPNDNNGKNRCGAFGPGGLSVVSCNEPGTYICEIYNCN